MKDYAEKFYEIAQKLSWRRDWLSAGCYLHLECSELIEALRGKGKESAEHELGDVLFILLSMARHYGIDIDNALKKVEQRNIKKIRGEL